jgi:hypothetical protein
VGNDTIGRKQLLQEAELPLLRDFFSITTGHGPTPSQELILTELLEIMHREAEY